MIDFSQMATFYIGNEGIKTLYINGRKVWENGSGPGPGPGPDFNGLTFTARQASSTISMSAVGSAPTVNLQYSTNEGETWNTFTVGSTTVTLQNVGDRVCFKATTTNQKFSNASDRNYNNFVLTGQLDLSGNINSLLDGSDMDSVSTAPQYAYACLFDSCTALVDASQLQLKSSTTQSYAYTNMFYGCSNLTKGPEILATSLGSSTMQYMFGNCSVLNQVKLWYTGSFVSTTFRYWMMGVQTTSGTFYYNGSYTTRGTSAIPTNWTITTFST